MAKRITLYAGGKEGATPWGKVCGAYLQRMHLWHVRVVECKDVWFTEKAHMLNSAGQGNHSLQQCAPDGIQKGRGLKSARNMKNHKGAEKEVFVSFHQEGLVLTNKSLLDFMVQWMHGAAPLGLCVGPSHGLPPAMIMGADACFSLGHLTWCHMSARALVLQQLYRCQQTLCNHPYSNV